MEKNTHMEESEPLFKICHVSSFIWSKTLAAHKHHNIRHARWATNKHQFGLTTHNFEQ